MKNRWLFKARKESDNEWTQGFLSRIGKTNSYQINGILVKTNTICQCTGLKDCEGNLIFEGDLVFDEKTMKYGIPVIHKHGSFGIISEGIFSPLSDFRNKTKKQKETK